MKKFFFIFILALIPFASTTVSAESDLPLISEAGIIIDAKSGKVLYEKNINKKYVSSQSNENCHCYICY